MSRDAKINVVLVVILAVAVGVLAVLLMDISDQPVEHDFSGIANLPQGAQDEITGFVENYSYRIVGESREYVSSSTPYSAQITDHNAVEHLLAEGAVIDAYCFTLSTDGNRPRNWLVIDNSIEWELYFPQDVDLPSVGCTP